MDEELEQEIAAAEQAIAAEVRAVLDEVAADIAAELGDATEIVAARFSLARIGRTWTQRVPRLMRRLLGVAETAAQQAASDVDRELPAGWDDLPGRHDSGDDLPASLGSYVTDTEHLLRAVGDRLTEAAVTELAAGLDAGEDIAALRARLRGLFSRDGAELGETREERIARTESTRAWNAATLAAGEDLTGEGRPLVKQWQTRRDARVRDAHDDADGQLRLLDEAFTVAGVPMAYPGDPAAPAALNVNCRCVLRLAPEQRTAAYGSKEGQRAEVFGSKEKMVTADGSHLMGGMIALLPRDDDAQFLALPDGEDVGELHCTLWFLGDDAGQWTDGQRNELVAAVSARAVDLPGPVVARAFGVNHWNPDSDNPAWVWAVGDDRDHDGPGLLDARGLASWALEDTHDRPDTPAQHTPWVAHVTGAYAADAWPFDQMCERLGAITFDRIRVAFAGDHYDIPIGPAEEAPPMATAVQAEPDTPPPPPVRSWSTPDGAALAFENEQTGDGRVFAPSALFWDAAGPWPLQYAEAMGQGHEGAELAGAIQTLGREGNRITGSGVLYLTQAAGFDAAMLLDQDAPLGVSVDLDDVDVQLVDTTTSPEDEEAGPAFLEASFASASVMRLADGAWMITGRSRAEWTASGAEMAHSSRSVMLFTSPGGTITGATARRVFGDDITAAAGDSDPGDGVVFHEEKSGEYLVRITRARLRGATLVSMPAYNKARIVLDPLPDEQTASAPIVASSGSGHERLVTYVRSSPTPVGPRHLAHKLGMSLETVHSHLSRALEAGTVVRIARGLYVGASTLPEGELTAAACGDLDLPVHDDREAPWDGGKAGTRVLAWATDDQGDVDPDKLAQAFLWRDPDKDPATAGAYKLPFADVFGDGEAQRLEIVADGVTSVAAVLDGSMGGVDLPDDDRKEIRAHVETLYGKLAKAFDDPALKPLWSDEATAAAALDALYDESGAEIVASAWHAMQDEQPMPAAWFREPTAEELPPGSGGVHIVDGRAYGWVAQAGVPHAVHGRKVTIEKLAARGLDLSHFLRARFRLDDGTDVRAGAMTMNVGHHRDGYECESAVCQFDDSRTVAAVVTVGMNKGGLWFSGAAAPWLSPWDRTVFSACQPSYHMTQGTDGRWQLKAVLSVPVPGHSSPLTAAAVVDRSNLALTAAAVAAETSPPSVAEPEPEHTDSSDHVPAANAVQVTAALLDPSFLDQFADALKAREETRAAAARTELAELTARLAPVRAELAASAAQQPEGN
ncbi:phage minor head protein [Streptomyces sp. NPDC012616]|uniref:phage minor head protein n=1 Tax=Streptomyces sp. NPDC012616 TaxID=3364840 RepID=UPI0036F07740